MTGHRGVHGHVGEILSDVVNLDRSRLEGAPSYSSSDTSLWDDPTYGRRIDEYYHF
jgi:hypothetical protein